MRSSTRHAALGTISFTVCFAGWGLISAFAPRFRDLFHLSASQTALLVAVPVILGALARIPMGMLTDRFGGRLVFSGLMAGVAVPIALVPFAGSFAGLLATAFFLGVAGSSFAVGVGYVSRWTPPEQQGSALGVYGLGNIGQSAAVFLGPLVAVSLGWEAVFYGTAGLLLLWTAVFAVSARNAPVSTRPQTLGEMIQVLTRERLAWALSLFYFLTFGGFVAFSIYLPVLLRSDFGLGAVDAGFRAAGFVVLATCLRPVGGWLSDKIGGARVLAAVFPALVPFAMLLAWPSIVPFSVGALGCASLLGLGNGAVFKLVPQYFPREAGTVTGLVGAMGGLGGFFPPLLLGFFRDHLGAIWPGFLLLAATALVNWWVNHRVFVPRQEALEMSMVAGLTRTRDRLRAGTWATLWTGLLIAAIVVGSRNLQNFDPALVVYTFAVIFAAWGVIYHYNVWIHKPPTRVYWERGWELYRERGFLRGLGRVVRLAAVELAAQPFIRRRSSLRWWMHQFLFWGCILAVLITFPLVFGWISFGTLPNDQMTYVTYLFGFPAGTFRIRTFASSLVFHLLDVSAFLVLAGIALSLWRRMRDSGARAVQSFGMDFLPLILLFAISVTGLGLTVSQAWLRGQFYSFLAITHAITVIAATSVPAIRQVLSHFPEAGATRSQTVPAGGHGRGSGHLRPLRTAFASRMHIHDLKRVLPQVGFDYELPGAPGHWQELCPVV